MSKITVPVEVFDEVVEAAGVLSSYVHNMNDREMTVSRDDAERVIIAVDALRAVALTHVKRLNEGPIVDDGWEQTLKGHSDWVTSVAVSPNGRYIASGSRDETLRIYDASTGLCERILAVSGHSARVTNVTFSPDGERIRTLQESSVPNTRVIDAINVAFSPDSVRIVVTGVAEIRVYSVLTGECEQTLQGHTSEVNAAAFSPDGTLIVSGSDDGFLRIYDATSGVCKLAIRDDSAVTSVAFSPDGKCVISGSYDNSVRVWNVESGERIWSALGHADTVTSVAFSPDGTRIVSGSDDCTLRLLNAENGEHVRTLKGHENWVNSVAFSSDSKWIVSGSDDNSVRVWDVSSGECKQTLRGHSHTVTSVAFFPDNRFVVSGSYDKTVKVWG